MKKRGAVLGAGPSGLARLRAFQSAAQKGEDKHHRPRKDALDDSMESYLRN